MAQPQTQGDRVPHTTAADVFSYLLMFLMLYITVVFVLMLLFDYVDTIYPPNDPFGYFTGGFRSNRMIVAMAALVVVWPVYVVLAWLTGKWIKKDRNRRNLGIRRWLVYLTLFAASITLIIDLITLVYNFLSGGLTLSFALKVFAVLVVAGAVFGYYLWEMRRKAERSILPRVFAIVASVLLLAAIVGGFFIAGSPWEQRDRRFDERRVSDLQTFQNEVYNFYSAKSVLPANQSELTNDVTGFALPKDPESGAPYGYETTGDLTFRLCANFSLEQTYSTDGFRPMMEFYPSPYGYDANWDHPAGRHCYDREIDPDRLQILYPGADLGKLPPDVISVPPLPEDQGLKVYIEERYGAQLEYPEDWQALTLQEDQASVAAGLCTSPQNIFSFAEPDQELSITVGFRKVGEEVGIWCRSGVGAGEFVPQDPIMIAGQEAGVEALVFEENAVEVFVTSGNTAPVEVDGYELVATVSSASTQQGSGQDIRDHEDYDAAIGIVESLLLPNTAKL